MYLVDANVISSAAPSKAPTHSAVVDWMEAHSDTLYVSVVTVAEIADGIAKLHREGATRKAAGLKAWSDALLHLYAARILAVDVGIARRLGELSDRARSLGRVNQAITSAEITKNRLTGFCVEEVGMLTDAALKNLKPREKA